MRARYPNGSVVANVEIRTSDRNGRILIRITNNNGIAFFGLDVKNPGGDLIIQVCLCVEYA